jgi:hypothetical protein
VQFLPSVAERKAAFEEFCKEAAGKKKVGGASRAGSVGKAAPAAKAAAPASSGPAAGFEALLDEIELACRGGGAVPPVPGDEEGQLLPGWEPGLQLDELEGRWGSDPRWQAAPADRRRAALDARLAPLRQEARRRREADFRALLREAGVGVGSRWHRTKDDISGDERYMAVPREDRWAGGAVGGWGGLWCSLECIAAVMASRAWFAYPAPPRRWQCVPLVPC